MDDDNGDDAAAGSADDEEQEEEGEAAAAAAGNVDEARPTSFIMADVEEAGSGLASLALLDRSPALGAAPGSAAPSAAAAGIGGGIGGAWGGSGSSGAGSDAPSELLLQAVRQGLFRATALARHRAPPAGPSYGRAALGPGGDVPVDQLLDGAYGCLDVFIKQ